MASFSGQILHCASHRLVILMAKQSSGPNSLDLGTVWETYQKLPSDYKIKNNFTSKAELDFGIREMTSFLHACRKRAATPVFTYLSKTVYLFTDQTLHSLIHHPRRRGQLHGAQVVAEELRDITATSRKKISHLRILEWDRVLRAFTRPDPHFLGYLPQNFRYSGLEDFTSAPQWSCLHHS